MLESYILSLIEISLQQLNWVIEEMYRSKGVIDCDMTYVWLALENVSIHWMKFAISYHNHASSNVLLDFAASFSLPAINQSGFFLFFNHSTQTYINMFMEENWIHIYMHLKIACEVIEYCVVAKQFKAMDLGLWLCDKMASEEAMLQNCSPRGSHNQMRKAWT